MNRITVFSSVAVLLALMASGPSGAAERKGAPRLRHAAQSGTDAAAAGLQVPVVGYVTRSSRAELRPILGIPGAVAVGDALVLPDGLASLELAPGQQYAIAKWVDAGVLSILPVTADGAGNPVDVAGAWARPDRIEFSPGGSAAAVYSAQGKAVQIILGAPSSPRVARQVDLSGLSGPAAAIAVSDDGQLLLVSSPDGGGSTVTLFPAGGDGRTVARGGDFSALRFFPGAQDAAMADRQRNQILLLAADGSSQAVAGNADGVDTPAALATAAGHRVFIANQGSSPSFLDLDIDAVTAVSIPCSFKPAGLRSLLRTSTLWLTDAASDDVWAVNTDLPPESVSYVPPLTRNDVANQ